MDNKKVHFVGIGGIGISAIARMFLLEGKEVSGTDLTETPLIENLKKAGLPAQAGAKITIGQGKEFIPPDADLIIYTLALEKYDPELLAYIKTLSVPSISYPEALGLISKEKFTIAISGTHGKTTTTAMVATVLEKAGLDPSAVVGSLVHDWQSNYRAGKSRYLVVEADEYRRSFLNLTPQILVITNIDADHLDYYRDLADIQSAFAELVAKIPKDGYLICNPNDPSVAPVSSCAQYKVIDYSTFGGSTSKLKLKLPGKHNIENARAALAVCATLGVEQNLAIGALNDFNGIWRRFEYKGKTKTGAIVYDDYAHNPAKIRAALAGCREKFPDKRLVAVFMPHLYSRTRLLFDDFVKSFEQADEVIIAPIFAAREKPDPEASPEKLAAAIASLGKKSAFLPTFEAIADYLEKNTSQGDVIMTIGAGDIYKVAEKICQVST